MVDVTALAADCDRPLVGPCNAAQKALQKAVLLHWRRAPEVLAVGAAKWQREPCACACVRMRLMHDICLRRLLKAMPVISA